MGEKLDAALLVHREAEALPVIERKRQDCQQCEPGFGRTYLRSDFDTAGGGRSG